MERDLLRRHLQGDGTAFEALVEQHQSALLRYALRLSGSEEDARDAVQETFLKLVRHGPELTAGESWVAWLYRVCRNLCADRARKEARMQVRHMKVAVPDLSPREALPLEQAETSATVDHLLSQLPDQDREVLLLKVHQGRSYREIAQITGLSLHKVSVSIHRGLRRMAADLKHAGLID